MQSALFSMQIYHAHLVHRRVLTDKVIVYFTVISSIFNIMACNKDMMMMRTHTIWSRR